jgi:hypothetical protein
MTSVSAIESATVSESVAARQALHWLEVVRIEVGSVVVEPGDRQHQEEKAHSSCRRPDHRDCTAGRCSGSGHPGYRSIET